jgi:hypothetical protein
MTLRDDTDTSRLALNINAPAVDPNLVMMAEKILAMVKTGQITTLGVIMSGGPATYNKDFYGPNVLELNLGIDSLKRALLDAIEGRANAQAPRSPIIRARPGG